MDRLISKHAGSKDRIFPYIGGEEVNDSPTHAHHRYVINFEGFPLRRDDLGASWNGATEDQQEDWLRDGIVPLDYPDPVAADWPDLLAIVEEKIKGHRASHSTAPWWQFERLREELYSAIRPFGSVLAINCGATPHMSFAFVSGNQVFANTLVIIADDRMETFTVLQSRVHEAWTRREASSMKDDLRYAKEDCFETFPFPTQVGWSDALELAGCAYYEFRAQLMQRENRGLTTIYNWFHDPDCECPGIEHLRVLHNAIDRAVLDAYGWTDLQARSEFISEFDEEEDEDENGRARKKYRYRWPDGIRDDVLARLLELNRQRALEEGQLPTETPVFVRSSSEPQQTGGRKKRGKRSGENLNLSLLPQGNEEA